MPEISFTRRRASASVSFTSFSITYSKVMRSEFDRRGYSRSVSSRVSMFQRLLIGTSLSRTSSVVAWKDTARRQPISSAHLAISGTTPEVDSVMRRRDREIPSPSMAIFIASRTLSKL